MTTSIPMTAKITITIAIILAISVIVSLYFYQKSNLLEVTLSNLQEENRYLRQSIENNKNGPTTVANETSGPIPPDGLHPQDNQTSYPVESNLTSQSITAVAVKAVPVTDGFFESVQYEGTVMDITVDIRDGGDGLVLVNTEVPTGVDFQSSARTAVRVAQAMTKADLSDKDIIFSIKSKGNSTSSDLQAVDGPSAGAAMTVLLAAELQSALSVPEVVLSENVLITGTINADGTVGQVGGIPEKAQAAGRYGAQMFLVPAGQAFYNEQTCESRQEGPFVYQTCRSQQRPLSEFTEENYGMTVIEVRDIEEALDYFQAR